MKRLYTHCDEWLTALSRGRYAVSLGTSGGVGVLAAGMSLRGELLLVRAFTVALVMFGLEYTFGRHQSDE
jgi:hypothetical protein